MLRIRNFRRPIEQRFNRCELLNQLARAFFADSRGAWNVVGAIAPKRKQIRNLFRSHAEQLAHLFPIDDHVVLRCVQDQGGIDQLVEVLVESDYDGMQSSSDSLCRNARYDVVGFVSWNFKNRNSHRLTKPANVRYLLYEVRRHLL